MLNELLIKELSEQVGINTSEIQIIKDAEIYSTSEVKTNKVWVDGEPIYRKVLTGKLGSMNNWNNIYAGNFKTITSIHGYFQAGNEFYMMPRSYNNQEIAFYWRSNGNLYEMHNYDYCNNKDYIIVLEYTKTTD